MFVVVGLVLLVLVWLFLLLLVLLHVILLLFGGGGLLAAGVGVIVGVISSVSGLRLVLEFSMSPKP